MNSNCTIGGIGGDWVLPFILRAYHFGCSTKQRGIAQLCNPFGIDYLNDFKIISLQVFKHPHWCR